MQLFINLISVLAYVVYAQPSGFYFPFFSCTPTIPYKRGLALIVKPDLQQHQSFFLDFFFFLPLCKLFGSV